MGSVNCGAPRPRAYQKGIFFKTASTNQNHNGNYNDNSKTPVKLDFFLENAEKVKLIVSLFYFLEMLINFQLKE